MDQDFHGAKLILWVGPDLVILERDHSPGIPWPGYLDLPGGGREANETAQTCALRETREEIGLTLRPADLIWRHPHDTHEGRSWFFAARLAAHAAADIRFGGEGAGWRLMRPEAYMDHPMAIPHFADLVARALKTLGTV